MAADPEANRADKPSGQSYFVDSLNGSDQNTGKATVATASGGPWRSLSRLARAKLQPGDTVVLACNSIWRETLSLTGSGSSGKPIILTAPPGGCTTGPMIDGSVEIPASAWQAGSGKVLTASFAQTPLQLHSAGAVWLQAHHPNAGQASANPRSVYLPMPGPGDTLLQGQRQRSSSMLIGTQQNLPAGAPGAGALVHVRTNSWALETRRVTALQAGKLVFDRPTDYVTQPGWGYFLTGERWMVDSPGEWHHDPASQQLSAMWPAGGEARGTVHATVLTAGADLRGLAHITLRGLTIRRVGTGLQVSGTQHVRLQNLIVEDIAGVGVAATASQNLFVENSRFERTGLDAIQGVGGNGKEAVGMVVRLNTIRESGVHMVNGVNTSLPVRSYAAVYAGPSAVIEGNTIQHSGYIGIRFMQGSTVEANVVEDSCLVLNDCGAIYTWGAEPNNSQVLGNIVARSHGNLDGTPAGTQTAAQGIYLDDNTTGVLVADNSVTEADHGIQVHIAQRNTLRANVLFNNRRSQLWMQANANALHPAGDVIDNEVLDNLLAATAPGSVPLLLHSSWGSTAQFGRFDGNRYLENANGVAARERTASGLNDFSFRQWRTARGVASVQPLDAAGFSVRSLPFASYAVAGGSLVTSSPLGNHAESWQHWNPSAEKGALLREACARGNCLRYQPGGAPGTLSSPSFSVREGTWYRLSVDLLADKQDQPVRLVLRRAGGSGGTISNRYEMLTDSPMRTTAGTTWQRRVFVFRASKTATQNATPAGDAGARIDFEDLGAGRSLSLAGLELMPLALDTAAPTGMTSLTNKQASALALPCPMPAAQAKACGWLHRLSDGKPVSWPFTLAALRSELLYVQNPSLADTDRDGIADRQDLCPGTPPEEAVNAVGCALAQR